MMCKVRLWHNHFILTLKKNSKSNSNKIEIQNHTQIILFHSNAYVCILNNKNNDLKHSDVGLLKKSMTTLCRSKVECFILTH